MENKTGLKSEFLKELHAQILSFPGIEQVFIFGSRARGDYRKYSDVDLAIFGEQVSFETLGAVRGFLEELPTIYRFDLVHFDKQTNEQLKASILKEGISLTALLEIEEERPQKDEG